MTLGQRIQKLRKEKAFSQEEMAAALGVSRQAVSKWENDISSPDTENLIALAAVLGTELSSLVSEEHAQPIEQGPASDVKPVFPWMKVLLILLVLVALAFFIMWQGECLREEKLELLCRASASGCLDALGDYKKTGESSYYISAVSDFRAFMQAYHLLTEDSSKHGNYTFLNEAYGYMLCNPDKIDENLPLLIKAMDRLAIDVYDFSGHELMYDLYIALRHG